MEVDPDGGTVFTADAAQTKSYLYYAAAACVGRTEGGVTRLLLVDGQNPTGYAQVLEEKNAPGASAVVEKA
ncbi:MAG: hypothetical protein ACRCT8_10795 [Lacipirellulaceae bacterium]